MSLAGAMGRDDNPAAVLDTEARVRGVSGLRVVDASSMPTLGPGHPMATICKFIPFVLTRQLPPDRHLTASIDILAEKVANAIIKGKLE